MHNQQPPACRKQSATRCAALVLMRSEGTGGSPGFHTSQMDRPARLYFGFDLLKRQREGLNWRKGDTFRVEVWARDSDVEVNAIRWRSFNTPFDHNFSLINMHLLRERGEVIFDQRIQRTTDGEIKIIDGELHVYWGVNRCPLRRDRQRSDHSKRPTPSIIAAIIGFD